MSTGIANDKPVLGCLNWFECCLGKSWEFVWSQRPAKVQIEPEFSRRELARLQSDHGWKVSDNALNGQGGGDIRDIANGQVDRGSGDQGWLNGGDGRVWNGLGGAVRAGNAIGDVGELALDGVDCLGEGGGAAVGGVEFGVQAREEHALVDAVVGDQGFAPRQGAGDLLVGAAAKFRRTAEEFGEPGDHVIELLIEVFVGGEPFAQAQKLGCEIVAGAIRRGCGGRQGRGVCRHDPLRGLFHAGLTGVGPLRVPWG